jgi:hypothetical protein
LQVEEADRPGRLATEGLAAECDSQRLPMQGVVRVIALELAVCPMLLALAAWRSTNSAGRKALRAQLESITKASP